MSYRPLLQRLPLLSQLKTHGQAHLTNDLIAGAITAVMLVPQVMAYAMLAGLPPQTGLYAAVLPALIYALFGSSRVLSVGPVAVVSLMVVSALSVWSGGGSSKYLSGAVILAAESGVLLLILGMLRLGALVNFISHPVLSGFTMGAALLIIVSQLGALLGIEIPREHVADTLALLASQLPQVNITTALFAAATLALLLLAQKPLQQLLVKMGSTHSTAVMTSRVTPLLVVIAATVLAALSRIDTTAGVAVVGTIPSGLPLPNLKFLASTGWIELLPSAALIALVGYVESISIAKTLAARRRQRIDANQELTALGSANIAAAIAGSLPVAGSFSRSAINFDTGANTQLAGVIVAIIVGVVALLFTHWFHYLPDAVLAAVIVVAVAKLIDISAARRVWAYDKADGLALTVTAIAVLAVGIEKGLVLGIGLSLALYLWRTSKPHMAVIGRIPDTEHYRNIDRHAVETESGTLILRVDENLYFANADAVQICVLDKVAESTTISNVVLVLSAVNYVDTSALEMLENLEADLREAGTLLHLAEVKGPVMDRLKRSPLLTRLGDKRIHLTTFLADSILSEGTID